MGVFESLSLCPRRLLCAEARGRAQPLWVLHVPRETPAPEPTPPGSRCASASCPCVGLNPPLCLRQEQARAARDAAHRPLPGPPPSGDTRGWRHPAPRGLPGGGVPVTHFFIRLANTESLFGDGPVRHQEAQRTTEEAHTCANVRSVLPRTIRQGNRHVKETELRRFTHPPLERVPPSPGVIPEQALGLPGHCRDESFPSRV